MVKKERKAESLLPSLTLSHSVPDFRNHDSDEFSVSPSVHILRRSNYVWECVSIFNGHIFPLTLSAHDIPNPILRFSFSHRDIVHVISYQDIDRTVSSCFFFSFNGYTDH